MAIDVHELSKVDPRTIDAVEEERHEDAEAFRDQFFEATPLLMQRTIGVGIEKAREGIPPEWMYLEGVQVGILIAARYFASRELEQLLEIEWTGEEPILPDDFGVLGLPPAGELPNGLPEIGPSQG